MMAPSQSINRQTADKWCSLSAGRFL